MKTVLNEIGPNVTNSQYLEKDFVKKISFSTSSFLIQFYLSYLVTTSEDLSFSCCQHKQQNTACKFSKDFIKGYFR